MDYIRAFKTNQSREDDEQLINEDDKIFDDIPRQPTRLLYYFLISILLIIITAICIRLSYKDNYWKASLHVWIVFVIFFLTLAISSLISQVINFFAELEHLEAEYDGQLNKVLKATFDFNVTSIILIILCCSSIVIFQNHFQNINNNSKYFNVTNLLILISAVIMCHSVNLFESKSTTLQAIDSLGGVDYGTGMALSYFYGYLKIILPSDGKQNPGIRTKMIDYESTHNVTIPVKKLFILIPESGHIPPDLKDVSDNWLESTRSLINEIQDRAGIKRRSYKNTVYKIHPGGDESHRRPVYITVEGATPILTLNEIIKHSHKQTETYRHLRKEIVAKFYTTLQDLLNNDPDCRDFCELVYYDDYPKKKKVNIGVLLLDRIRLIASTSY